MTDLVGRIEMLAKEKGLTIKALERMAGVGNGSIRRWQTQSPRLDRLLLVAGCLDVSLDYLVSGTAAPMQTQCADFSDPALALEEEQLLAACRALPPAARLDVLDYALFKLRRRPESPKSGSGEAR